MSKLIITRGGVPCPDQKAALEEFKARCEVKTPEILPKESPEANEVTELRWMLLELLRQHCESREDPRIVDSGFISANARAIRYLFKCGMLQDIYGDKGVGRGVSGKVPDDVF